MSAPPTQPTCNGCPPESGPTKHRACDDCRSRKLACTKEPEGCARCKREGISCHYSAQKKMGRPRKSPDFEEIIADPSPSAPTVVPAMLLSPAFNRMDPVISIPDVPMDVDPPPFTDPSLAAPSSAGFLGILGPDFVSSQYFHAEKWQPEANPLERDIWNFDIDFDILHPGLPPVENSDTNTPLPGSVAFTTPSLSYNGETTPGHAHVPAKFQPEGCDCLASLYHAIDALACLPTEVTAAIRVARAATKAALDNTHCQICCPPPTEAAEVSTTGFQNMMLLCALIPSLVDAYRRILDKVEAETARAARERRQLHFSLSELGGMWGRLGASEALCDTGRFEDVTMGPAMWRVTVRALLKVDVYGFDCGPEDLGHKGPSFSQPGLKDITAQMDEKSRFPHARVDAMMEAGMPGPTGPNGVRAKHPVGWDPHCRRIVEMAKEAMDSLDIP